MFLERGEVGYPYLGLGCDENGLCHSAVTDNDDAQIAPQIIQPVFFDRLIALQSLPASIHNRYFHMDF